MIILSLNMTVQIYLAIEINHYRDGEISTISTDCAEQAESEIEILIKF